MGTLGELIGARVRGTLGDVDPLNKVPSERDISQEQNVPPHTA